MIPEGWSRKNLKDVIEGGIKNGYSPLPAHNETGLWVLGLGALQEGEIKLSEVKPAPDDKKVRESFLESGDFLVSRSNTPEKVGRVAVFRGESKRYSYPDLMMRFRVSERKANPEFMEQLLKSSSVRGYFRSSSAGSSGSMVKINKSVVEKTPLLLPPLCEQEKIARTLSAWDSAITISERLVETGQQQKNDLSQQLLTGKRRLPGFGEGWRLVKMGDIAKRVSEKNNGQSNNVVTISGKRGLIRQTDFFNKSVASEILDGYTILRKGQFAYNKSYSDGYPMGAVKRLNLYEDAVVTSLYICFEVHASDACEEFMEHYFESGVLNRGLKRVAAEGGRAHGLLNVKPSDFFDLKLALPPKEEQKAIAKVLSHADAEIEAQQRRLDCLRREKKALMQQLLTGKRRVKVKTTAPTEEAAC